MAKITTKNLGLELTDDANLKFKDWREVINGNKAGDSKSNTQIIDDFAGQTNQSIEGINQSITDVNQAVNEANTLAENAYGKGGTFSIAPADWQNLSYTVALADLEVNDAIFLTPTTDADNENLISARTSAIAATGSVTFTVEAVPTGAVAFNYFIAKGKGTATTPICYLNVQNTERVQGNVQADFTTTNPEDPSFIKNNPFVQSPSEIEILVEMDDIGSETGDAPVVDVLPIPNTTTMEEDPSEWVPCVEYGLESATPWPSKISLTVGETIHATCTCDQGTVDFIGKVRELVLPSDAPSSALYISDVEVKESEITSADFPYTLELAPRTVFFWLLKSDDAANSDFITFFFKFKSLAADTEANVQQPTNVKVTITKQMGTLMLPAEYVDIPESEQADLNVTDPEDPAYIKNNPFEVCADTLIDLDSLYLDWETRGTPSQFHNEDFFEWAPKVWFDSYNKLPLQVGDTVRTICSCDQGETVDFTGVLKRSTEGTLYISDGDPFAESLENYKVFLDINEDGHWSINFYFLDLIAATRTAVVQITNPKVKIIKCSSNEESTALPFKNVNIYDEISEQVAFTYDDAAYNEYADTEQGSEFQLIHSSRQLDSGVWAPIISIENGTNNIPEILTEYGEIIHTKCECDQGIVEATGKVKPVPIFREGEGFSDELYVSDIDIYSDSDFSDQYQVVVTNHRIEFQFLDLAVNTEAEVPELTNVVVTISKVKKKLNKNFPAILNTTVTTTPTDWTAEKKAVKAVSGITTDNTVIVSPAPESYTAYCKSKIRAIEQGDGTITFACEEVPTEDIRVNLVLMPSYPSEE